MDILNVLAYTGVFTIGLILIALAAAINTAHRQEKRKLVNPSPRPTAQVLRFPR